MPRAEIALIIARISNLPTDRNALISPFDAGRVSALCYCPGVYAIESTILAEV
jgi:hypothetical protein